jgi:hypothetical protein
MSTEGVKEIRAVLHRMRSDKQEAIEARWAEFTGTQGAMHEATCVCRSMPDPGRGIASKAMGKRLGGRMQGLLSHAREERSYPGEVVSLHKAFVAAQSIYAQVRQQERIRDGPHVAKHAGGQQQREQQTARHAQQGAEHDGQGRWSAVVAASYHFKTLQEEPAPREIYSKAGIEGWQLAGTKEAEEGTDGMYVWPPMIRIRSTGLKHGSTKNGISLETTYSDKEWNYAAWAEWREEGSGNTEGARVMLAVLTSEEDGHLGAHDVALRIMADVEREGHAEASLIKMQEMRGWEQAEQKQKKEGRQKEHPRKKVMQAAHQRGAGEQEGKAGASTEEAVQHARKARRVQSADGGSGAAQRSSADADDERVSPNSGGGAAAEPMEVDEQRSRDARTAPNSETLAPEGTEEEERATTSDSAEPAREGTDPNPNRRKGRDEATAARTENSAVRNTRQGEQRSEHRSRTPNEQRRNRRGELEEPTRAQEQMLDAYVTAKRNRDYVSADDVRRELSRGGITADVHRPPPQKGAGRGAPPGKGQHYQRQRPTQWGWQGGGGRRGREGGRGNQWYNAGQ